MLVDITHMSERAIADTFARSGPTRRSSPRTWPAASASSAYNLTDDVIREVGRRGGVMGVIACTHYTHDGLRAARKVKTFEDSMGCSTRTSTASRRSPARTTTRRSARTSTAGSSRRCRASSTSAACATSQDALATKYGDEVAEKISSGNVLALLRRAWR